MKEYEKWLKGKAGIGWYTGTAEGWRAALEWSQSINKEMTEEYQDSTFGVIKQSIAIDVELRGIKGTE